MPEPLLLCGSTPVLLGVLELAAVTGYLDFALFPALTFWLKAGSYMPAFNAVSRQFGV